MYYVRIEGNEFSFVVEEFHNILPTDIKITEEDYNLFFEQQSTGKHFKLKSTQEGSGLFDYIEEFTPTTKPIELTEEQKQIIQLQQENSLLKAQNQALSDRTDFHEELIAEMAMIIYS